MTGNQMEDDVDTEMEAGFSLTFMSSSLPCQFMLSPSLVRASTTKGTHVLSLLPLERRHEHNHFTLNPKPLNP